MPYLYPLVILYSLALMFLPNICDFLKLYYLYIYLLCFLFECNFVLFIHL